MNEELQNQKPTEQAAINRIGFDSLLEDIFGLNIRAFKTIGALFKSPAKYFTAAKTPNWVDKYTPSFRVWFGLMALLAALRFLYTSDTNIMLDAYTGMMEQIKTDLNKTKPNNPVEFDAQVAAKQLLKWMVVYFPFIYIPIMAITAIFYRAWTEKLSYVTRLRFLFGTAIPSSFIIFLITLSTIFINAKIFMAISAISLISMILLDFITAYRGPYAHVTSRAARIGRSLGLMMILFVVYMLTSFITMVPAFIMVFKNL